MYVTQGKRVYTKVVPFLPENNKENIRKPLYERIMTIISSAVAVEHLPIGEFSNLHKRVYLRTGKNILSF